MNKWIGSGKVTEEPVLRYNGDKVSFVAFTVMTRRNRKIRQGDPPVDFIDCICIGSNARLAREYLRKGKKVEVCGPLQSGHYTAKDGRKVYTKTVFVEDLSFGETKAEEEARLETEKAAEAAGHPEPAPDGFTMEIPEGIDAEIPFR